MASPLADRAMGILPTRARHLHAVPGGGASNLPPPSDAEIVAGLLRGEDAAAEALFDQCHQAVERTLLRILRTRDADFDDLEQVVFERVLLTVHERRYVGEFSLQKWAASIAAHVALDALRARGREQRYVLRGDDVGELAAAPGPGPDRRLEARVEVDRVQRCLARMKPELAEAFVLHDVFGHELVELAGLLGVTVAAAQSRLSRGRRELMRRLGVDSREEPP